MATWYERQRMVWIAETLHIFGFINRSHLQRKFWISQPQASKDLNVFLRRYPSAMAYDQTRKCYVVNDETTVAGLLPPPGSLHLRND